jgi:D-glycero-D-manno-heptose 1,7-bisphosphate phosphatase
LRRAVFLDRDGVLNRTVYRGGRLFVPSSLDELDILPGVREALSRLRAAGFLLIGATNQPDVARGLVSRASVEAIHELMRKQLPLDDIRVCFHVDADGCACRKPQPGMLFAGAVARQIQLARSFMVGDRWRDIGAGRAAGCTTILVNKTAEDDAPSSPAPDIELPDLPAAADWILNAANR